MYAVYPRHSFWSILFLDFSITSSPPFRSRELVPQSLYLTFTYQGTSWFSPRPFTKSARPMSTPPLASSKATSPTHIFPCQQVVSKIYFSPARLYALKMSSSKEPSLFGDNLYSLSKENLGFIRITFCAAQRASTC